MYWSLKEVYTISKLKGKLAWCHGAIPFRVRFLFLHKPLLEAQGWKEGA